MTDMPAGYYDRTNPEKNFEQHLFRAGFVLQSAEMNEIQAVSANRAKSIGDAIFNDGNVVRDARVVVDVNTGATICESGAVYLRGAVRGVPSATLTVPIDRVVAIGIWLVESVVSAVEDPTLFDPAGETRNYNEPGASRLKIEPKWGYDGDGTLGGTFYPIYYVDNGALRAKEAPPTLDGVSQAIARYDRDSAGSNYVVNGLRVSALDDLPDGSQVYNIEDGRARVNGFGVTLSASRRLIYPAVPDIRLIVNEPRTSATSGAQRIDVDRSPILAIDDVSITKESTASLVHAAFSGGQDPLPDTSVVSITEVKQGGTTYVLGTDYQLTAGKVDWSLPGAEPAPGSTYTATYRHITSVTPVDADDTGFTVSGAVAGTLVLTSYSVKLPRIDRLCMNEGGEFIWITGVPADYGPVRPSIPSNISAIAQVLQTWTADRQVINDGVRVVPMSDIEAMNARMDNITDLIAQQKLVSDIGVRDASVKKGLFVDPFLDDEQRDQGIAQTAAIANGALTLPIDGDAFRPSADVSSLASCAFTLEPVLKQERRTGTMNINPYMAFGILPSQVALTPAVDRWTLVETQWASPITQAFTTGQGGRFGTTTTTTRSSASALIKTSSALITTLRPIDVHFRIAGFGPGEALSGVTFDGIPVTAVP